MFFFILTSWLCLAPITQAQGSVEGLLGRINNLRNSLGLGAYTLNGELNSAATGHAQWMTASGQVSHYRDGTGPRDRANQAGYNSRWVSENIYMGKSATADVAWNFWVNSPVHYAGLTSPNYAHVGIGIATGANGNAFVLLFGNPNVAQPNVTANRNTSNNTNNNSNNDAPQAVAPPPPPSFVVGVDASGNIMHEVQPDHTLGEIALIYGYTWNDLDYIRELNGLENNLLEIGSIVLVPPQSGTFTPTPSTDDGEDDEAEATATPTPSNEPTLNPTDFELQLAKSDEAQDKDETNKPNIEEAAVSLIEPAVFQPIATATPPPLVTATAIVILQPSIQPTTVALAVTPVPIQVIAPPPETTTTSTIDNNPDFAPILFVVIAVQVGVLLFASAELIRRWRKK